MDPVDGPEPDPRPGAGATTGGLLDAAVRLARIDLGPPHRAPAAWRWAVATLVALAASLGADGALVAAGRAAFPTTTHYVHFHVVDYARVTIVGVLIACVGWPVVVRLCSAPRWLFARLAVAVTVVLWLPDLYLVHLGQTTRGVGVLMVMHAAIAIVTYNALVRLAPPRSRLVGTEVPEPA